MGKEQYVREMREHFCQENSKSKKVSTGCQRRKASRNTRSVAAGITSQRVLLEQVRCCNDTDSTHRMMKQGFIALKSGDWGEYKSKIRAEVKAT